MLEIALVISLTMAIVEVIKRTLRAVLPEEWVALLLPLVIVVVAASLNAANMAVFDPTVGWREAVRLEIAEGAAAAGNLLPWQERSLRAVGKRVSPITSLRLFLRVCASTAPLGGRCLQWGVAPSTVRQGPPIKQRLGGQVLTDVDIPGLPCSKGNLLWTRLAVATRPREARRSVQLFSNNATLFQSTRLREARLRFRPPVRVVRVVSIHAPA